MEVQQEPTQAPPQSVLDLLELDPKSLIDDLYNAVRPWREIWLSG